MPSSQPIASDLSYEVAKLRARRFELTTPPLDSRNEKLVSVPGVIERHAYIVSRETIHDANEWERHRRQAELSR